MYFRCRCSCFVAGTGTSGRIRIHASGKREGEKEYIIKT
jgi:hypothetical protein